MRYLVIAIFLVISDIAYAGPIASFNCERAASSDERLVCSDERAATLDSTLTGLYKLAIKVGGSGRKIKEQQANWLKRVRRKCTDLDCILQVYSSRIEEISKLLNKHTKPIPMSVTAKIGYPVSDSSYCEISQFGGWFGVIMQRNGLSLSGDIDGVYDCGRKVWGPIKIRGQVIKNIADIYYEGGFRGEGWAKAFVVLKGNRLYWQIYQEVRIESYEPDSEILKVIKR